MSLHVLADITATEPGAQTQTALGSSLSFSKLDPSIHPSSTSASPPPDLDMDDMTPFERQVFELIHSTTRTSTLDPDSTEHLAAGLALDDLALSPWFPPLSEFELPRSSGQVLDACYMSPIPGLFLAPATDSSASPLPSAPPATPDVPARLHLDLEGSAERRVMPLVWSGMASERVIDASSLESVLESVRASRTGAPGDVQVRSGVRIGGGASADEARGGRGRFDNLRMGERSFAMMRGERMRPLSGVMTCSADLARTLRVGERNPVSEPASEPCQSDAEILGSLCPTVDVRGSELLEDKSQASEQLVLSGRIIRETKRAGPRTSLKPLGRDEQFGDMLRELHGAHRRTFDQSSSGSSSGFVTTPENGCALFGASSECGKMDA